MGKKKSRRVQVKGGSQPLETMIQALVASLPGKCVSEDDAKGACNALHRLGELVVDDCDDEHKARTEAFVRAGGMSTIITLMRENPELACIQRLCCSLLYTAANVNSSGNKHNRLAIVESGGIPIVITSMNTLVAQQKHQDEEAKAAGSLVFHSLTLSCDLSEDNHFEAVREAGGVAMVVDILKHSRAQSLQREQEVFGNLALSLMDSMARMTAKKGIEEMSSLPSEIRCCGGIPNILASLKRFPNHPIIQWNGTGVMPFLSDPMYGDNRLSILAAGGDIVMKGVQRNGSRGPVGDVSEEAERVCNLLQEVVPQCHHCGKEAEDMMVCSRCKIAWHCNNDCFAADWKNHKAACNAARWEP